MHRTAWSKSSSLTSDKLRSGPRPGNNQGQGKGKGKQREEEPKSQAVQSLETLLQEVKTANGRTKDPKGGCFCLARNHKVSAYTPICTACGLILCFLNRPQYCCPHCSDALLTEANRGVLVEQIEAELASTIAKEIQDKERAILEAQQAAGAFPSLLGPAPQVQTKSPSPSPKPVQESRTVVTLSNKKKITVSSFTTVQKPSSSQYSNQPNQENQDPNEPTRVPPPREPPHASHQPNTKRPWENLIKGPVQYVSQPRIDDEYGGTEGSAGKAAGSSSRRRRGKGKQKESGTGS
ncbi:hypothetical protein BJ165DRAFT_1398733 [Panaeolus papilionaceus]|nr:hypothetical protein BJ165DRAFT_1398733 [Panaeolus papilionaceus]